MPAHNQNGSVLMVITGSIAAVKTLDVIRELVFRNVRVTCVLTKSGEQFVTPMSLAALTGQKVYQDLFSLDDETEMGHIALSRNHDLVVVVPASANMLAKMTYGLADDLASTLLLATDKPVMVVPAMNVRMWEHAATKRNVKQLKKDGIQFVGPAKGSMACGEEGWGRMVEPSEVVETIATKLRQKGSQADLDFQALSGVHAIVTSGPTREKIDPVRYISNLSSGKQGHAIARALKAAGADVTLISGPTNLPDPEGVNVVHVECAQEMYDAAQAALPAEVAVCCAAVADWKTADRSNQKIKKQKDTKEQTFTFAENPDILVSLSKHSSMRPKLVVGFAAETEHVIENARVKLDKKGCDWIVANDVANSAVFESDENTVHLIQKHTEEHWPTSSKEDVAQQLVERIGQVFAKNTSKRLKVVTKK